MIRKFLAVAAPLALVAPAAIASGGAPAVTTTISNEATVTWWAHSAGRAAIRRAPSDNASVVTRMHYMTEDGQPEVYLVLRRRTAGAAVWLQVRIPMRPNGRTGWVRRGDLGPLHVVSTQIVVDEARLRATLYRHGHAIWTSVVGIGAPGTPTPKGHFYVREKLTGYASPFYGPVALGTSGYSVLSEWPHGGVVGMHGTNEPQLLPGRVSHGCIRIPNDAVLRLAQLTPVGTPILIR
jgi:lipoprotein-anchoring transpeptidase ErfK/SrfK